MNNRIHGYLWALLAAGTLLVPVVHGACNFSLSPGGRNHGYGATTNSFSVIVESNCTWEVTNSVPWIALLTNATGTGSNLVTYSIGTNPNLAGRSTTLTVANQSFVITQDPALCSYSLVPGT